MYREDILGVHFRLHHRGNEKTVKLLLEKGAHVNVQGEN